MNLREILEKKDVGASVPCRVDLGGTLDISTFFLPLGYLKPVTVNIALDMRTKVTLSPWRDGYIKISSRGFESAEFEANRAPFNHPMGLMFAVASFFNANGVHIKIESSSPPRSALGGSSAAAVAMIAAFRSAFGDVPEPAQSALLAHYIESSVAGVPCGLQDQLAAAYGGVNCWHWKIGANGVSFTKENLITKEDILYTQKGELACTNSAGDKRRSEECSCKSRADDDLNQNIVIAYCGIPHVSSDINSRWVKSFLSGQNRDKWQEIIRITHAFSSAIKNRDFNIAATLMNQETRIRLDMTPDVLDRTGKELFKFAEETGCGARFTGAGGGGCLWAVGEKDNIQNLKRGWKEIVNREKDADLLDTSIDFQGIIMDT